MANFAFGSNNPAQEMNKHNLRFVKNNLLSISVFTEELRIKPLNHGTEPKFLFTTYVSLSECIRFFLKDR